MKGLLLAGEASGDLHASYLTHSLKEIRPDIILAGIGGKKMKKEGVNLLYPMDKISVMGFTEAIFKIRNFFKARRKILNYVNENEIDFAVTVDFPGFNIRMAKLLYNKNIPVFYFITPQVWAWGSWRKKQLKKYFRHLFVVLPFEEKYFKKNSIQATFLGNPILDMARASGELEKKELPSGEPLIALLPGSRESEIKRLLIPEIKAALLFREKHPSGAYFVALNDKSNYRLVKRLVDGHNLDAEVVCEKTYDALYHADIAIVSSGTATLESAIFKTPMVIIYKLSLPSWLIARALVRIKSIGLINLIYGEKFIPELVQNEVNPRNIARELERVYNSRQDIMRKFDKIDKILGSKGCYKRVADAILSMV